MSLPDDVIPGWSLEKIYAVEEEKFTDSRDIAVYYTYVVRRLIDADQIESAMLVFAHCHEQGLWTRTAAVVPRAVPKDRRARRRYTREVHEEKDLFHRCASECTRMIDEWRPRSS